MNVLITGGTGFIGEQLIPKLIEKGYCVRLLVRNLDKAKNKSGNTCEYVIGDVTDRKSLVGCCENIDVVLHMVAKVGNELPSEKTLKEFRAVNVEGTRNIIEESKKASIKKFVFISSIAAMGIVHEEIISEKSKCEPYLPYQVSKYEAELLINEEFATNNFPSIIIRPTKVYGIGENEFSYMTLAKLCKKGVFLKVGSGKNYTSNIYVTDLVQGLVQTVSNGVLGETYILTSENSIGFKESGKVIASVLRKKIITIPIPAKPMALIAGIQERVFTKMGKRPIVTKRNIEATAMDRVYDISKAKNELGFAPKTTLEEGIAKTVKWYIEMGAL